MLDLVSPARCQRCFEVPLTPFSFCVCFRVSCAPTFVLPYRVFVAVRQGASASRPACSGPTPKRRRVHACCACRAPSLISSLPPAPSLISSLPPSLPFPPAPSRSAAHRLTTGRIFCRCGAHTGKPIISLLKPMPCDQTSAVCRWWHRYVNIELVRARLLYCPGTTCAESHAVGSRLNSFSKVKPNAGECFNSGRVLKAYCCLDAGYLMSHK